MERQREAVAVVKAMAELADVPTQSVMEADGDDDMTSAGHVTKSCGEDGSPQGNPMKIDSVTR